jgi:hypothetical protein
MPSDSNGNYALPGGYLAVGGNTILPSQHNPPLEDIASGLTARLMRSGAGGMTGQVKGIDGTLAAPSFSFNTALTTGFYKTANGIGVAIGGGLAAEFNASGLIYGDQSVTYPKIVAPSAASRLLGSNANPALSITGAANNGSGLIRLTVASTSTFSTGQKKIVAGVTGATEANGRWTITVVDATHIDLQGSTFANFYVSGGTIGGGVDEIKIGTGLSLAGDTMTATLNPTLIPNYLSGLTMSTAGSSGTMTIATGAANDTTNATLMKLSASINKTTASWAVGSGSGGLDTGAIANSTWYHFYLIERVDTGVVDVVFSTNPAIPLLPASYTLYRRIGACKTNGSGQWTAFVQFGDQFLWLVPIAEGSTVTSSAAVVSLAGVPSGVKVNAHITGFFSNATAGALIYVQPGDTTVTAPNGATGLATCRIVIAGVGNVFSTELRTNTSAQIVLAVDTASSTVNFATQGWTDLRGKV